MRKKNLGSQYCPEWRRALGFRALVRVECWAVEKGGGREEDATGGLRMTSRYPQPNGALRGVWRGFPETGRDVVQDGVVAAVLLRPGTAQGTGGIWPPARWDRA
jgi:hypothetical protein